MTKYCQENTYMVSDNINKRTVTYKPNKTQNPKNKNGNVHNDVIS